MLPIETLCRGPVSMEDKSRSRTEFPGFTSCAIYSRAAFPMAFAFLPWTIRFMNSRQSGGFYKASSAIWNSSTLRLGRR